MPLVLVGAPSVVIVTFTTAPLLQVLDNKRRQGAASLDCHRFKQHELELKPIQTHMAQKKLLWVEVGAHAVRNRSKFAGTSTEQYWEMYCPEVP
jgi:hypothetical protein